MIENIRSQIGFANTPVKVLKINGKTLHGVLLGFSELEPINGLGEINMVTHSNLSNYLETEDPNLIETITLESIKEVDLILK